MGGKRVRAVAAMLSVLLAVGLSAARPVSAADGPTLSVGDQSGLERDLVTGSVFVPIHLSEAVAEPVVVSFHTVDGTATAGADYVRWGTPSNPRTVTIPAGAVQTQVNVPILADGEIEPDETFSVVVSNVDGGDVVLGRDSGTATIVDADSVSSVNPAITVSDTTLVEGDQGERRAQFLVHLSRAPLTNVTITYTTSDGTGVAGTDYRAKLPGTVVFAPGQISKTVDVAVTPNTVVDGSRSFDLDVTVTGGSPVEELDMVGTATIVDDDSGVAPCPVGTFNAVDGNEPCTPAAPGFFVDTEGALSATPCPPGTFQDQAGQTSCQLAPLGSYVQFSAQTAATSCPEGTTTTVEGATSIEACVPAAAPPVISSFSAVTPSGTSPVTTALTWTISDPELSQLSCELDLDDDTVFEMSISECTSASLRTSTFTDVGVNTVTLRVSNGSATATASTEVTVSPASPDTFDIMLRLDPAFTPEVAALIDSAATRWENVVTAGLPSQAVSVPAGTFFDGVPALNTTVDDVFIDVTLDAIDGPLSTVALGGAARFRPDGTTLWGAVAIDSDDLATLLDNPPAFVDTVTHEMGHVLLASPNYSSLRDLTDPAEPRFTGAAANGIYQELGGTGTIPMSGTAHWSESVFGTELMTPSFTLGVPSQLSALTAASLADLGYGVDLSGAEPYELPGPLLPSLRAGSPPLQR